MTSSQSRAQQEFTRQVDSMSVAPRFTDAARLQQLRDVAHLDPSMRVLDLGCGPGIVVEAFASHAGTVVGLDLTPPMLHRAAARCAAAGFTNTRFVLGESSLLPLADAVFDVAVTRSTLHHFDDPRAALREVARVLRPGGCLVVSDAVSSEDRDEAELHNALERLRDPSHVRMLPRSELFDAIREAGLEIEQEEIAVARREFDEWLAITNDASRVAPLRTVMRELACAGLHAGINLRYEDDRILFDHTTVIVRATRSS